MRSTFSLGLLLVAALMLASGPAMAASAVQGSESSASQCWRQVRQAKVALNTTSSEKKRSEMLDLIIEAEINRSRQSYRDCVDLAQEAISMGGEK